MGQLTLPYLQITPQVSELLYIVMVAGIRSADLYLFSSMAQLSSGTRPRMYKKG